MTLQELIERLRKILDTIELEEDLRKKLEELLRALEAGEPTAIVIARLLADILEYGADRLPGPIADFVKAYAEAFRNAIDEILGVLWRRYKAARESGMTHEEANEMVTWDAQVCAWLRLKWLLEHLPPPSPPEEVPQPMAPGTGTVPTPAPAPAPPTEPPVTAWAPEDHDCCKNLTPAERIPSVTVIAGYFYRDGGSWYVDVDIEVTHRCGLLREPHPRLYVVPMLGRPGIKIERAKYTTRPASGGKGTRFMWRRQQVSAHEPHRVQIHIRAISRCIGVYDGFVNIDKQP